MLLGYACYQVTIASVKGLLLGSDMFQGNVCYQAQICCQERLILGSDMLLGNAVASQRLLLGKTCYQVAICFLEMPVTRQQYVASNADTRQWSVSRKPSVPETTICQQMLGQWLKKNTISNNKFLSYQLNKRSLP